MNLTRIAVYPIKSYEGQWRNTAQVRDRGFEGDRRWMLIDVDGKFVSQRTVPELARVVSIQVDDGFRVTAGEASVAVQVGQKRVTAEIIQ